MTRITEKHIAEDVEIVIGCDFHPSFERIAIVDTTTGEIIRKTLTHSDGEAHRFYESLRGKKVVVGIESCGNTGWFEQMLGEMGHELWIGDAARIRAMEVRQQKTDDRDALLIQDLMVIGRFPAIWVPTPAERDTRQLILHRHRLVQMRTRVKNQLQHLALTWASRKNTSCGPRPDASCWNSCRSPTGRPGGAMISCRCWMSWMKRLPCSPKLSNSKPRPIPRRNCYAAIPGSDLSPHWPLCSPSAR